MHPRTFPFFSLASRSKWQTKKINNNANNNITTYEYTSSNNQLKESFLVFRAAPRLFWPSLLVLLLTREYRLILLFFFFSSFSVGYSPSPRRCSANVAIDFVCYGLSVSAIPFPVECIRPTSNSNNSRALAYSVQWQQRWWEFIVAHKSMFANNTFGIVMEQTMSFDSENNKFAR